MALKDLGVTLRNIVNRTLRRSTERDSTSQVFSPEAPKYKPLEFVRDPEEKSFYKARARKTEGDLLKGLPPVYGELSKETREKHGIGVPLDPGLEKFHKDNEALKQEVDEIRQREAGREGSHGRRHNVSSPTRIPPQPSQAEGERTPVR